MKEEKYFNGSEPLMKTPELVQSIGKLSKEEAIIYKSKVPGEGYVFEDKRIGQKLLLHTSLNGNPAEIVNHLGLEYIQKQNIFAVTGEHIHGFDSITASYKFDPKSARVNKNGLPIGFYIHDEASDVYYIVTSEGEL